MIGCLLRQGLRKQIFRLAKLPVIALGLVALLLTTNLLDTLKVVSGASRAAATALEQAPQIKQSQQAKP